MRICLAVSPECNDSACNFLNYWLYSHHYYGDGYINCAYHVKFVRIISATAQQRTLSGSLLIQLMQHHPDGPSSCNLRSIRCLPLAIDISQQCETLAFHVAAENTSLQRKLRASQLRVIASNGHITMAHTKLYLRC